MHLENDWVQHKTSYLEVVIAFHVKGLNSEDDTWNEQHDFRPFLKEAYGDKADLCQSCLQVFSWCFYLGSKQSQLKHM